MAVPNAVRSVLDSAQLAPAMNCHLVVSPLLWPATAGAVSYGELELPALETIMARGERTPAAGRSIERWLAATFDAGHGDELALAPFALRGDGGEPADYGWLCADPVHLRIHADRVVLADPSRLAIAADEARELVDTLNAHFAERGIVFLAPYPDRWYARVACAPTLHTTPTAEVAGRNIEAYLPKGKEQALWRSVFNETQMVLHEHPCNQRRERKGELTVNSLWFWGAGSDSPLRPNARYHAVWSNEAVAQGLARASGIEARPLPGSASDFVEKARETNLPDSMNLVVLPPLPGAAYGDVGAWHKALLGIETFWLAPLLAHTFKGTLSSLTLFALGPDTGWSTYLTRAHRLKFWRRRRHLSEYQA